MTILDHYHYWGKPTGFVVLVILNAVVGLMIHTFQRSKKIGEDEDTSKEKNLQIISK
jgi:hypothetical protein